MNPGNLHTAHGFRPNNNLASTDPNSLDNFHLQHPNQSLFNFNQHQHQHQPYQQQHFQSMDQEVQWQDLAMQMNNQQVNNNHNPAQHQHQQMFNQTPWANQLTQQPLLPNGMPNMGAFGMSFLPPQILQQAMAFSTPVKSNDESTLIKKLVSATMRGESYKDALNGLHGIDGHSASLWKDYYLDNKFRLDAQITMSMKKEKDAATVAKHVEPSDRHLPLPMVKKPSPDSFKRVASPKRSGSRLSGSGPSIKRPRKISSHSTATPPLIKDPPQSSRRSTINSLTAPSPIFGNRLPAPNADIKIPEPPSRSPSPPTNIIPQGRGNKYTQEDREFFVKFIGWRLKKDPFLTRSDLCELLEEKAPHHTAQSWASHWSNNHDVPDKILAAARGEQHQKYDDSPSSEEDDDERPPKKRPNYRDATTSEDSSESDSEGSEDDDSDEDDDVSTKSYSESEMGAKGCPFTDADLHITAKHISGFSDWEGASHRDRWDGYHEKHPQRSAKGWAEYYRRNERSLMKLATKMRDEGKRFPLQCARRTGVPLKRKSEFESDEEASLKRGKVV